MARIVICGYYGFNNSGDDELLLAISRDFEKLLPDAELTVLSGTPRETERVYGLRAVDRFSPLSVIREIAHADLFLFGGGSLIQDYTSRKSLAYYLLLLRIARLFHVPTMVYSNGIGPLIRKNDRAVRRVLDHVDVITLRDRQSLRTIEALGVKNPHIEVTADPAFSLVPSAKSIGDALLREAGIPEGTPALGVAIREWSDAAPGFVDILARACDYAKKKHGLAPVFIPMQQKIDERIARDTIAKMETTGHILPTGLPVPVLLSAIGSLQLCIGMRLHTIIYSAACCVPMIGIIYDPKVSGIMEQIGQNRSLLAENLEYEDLCARIDETMAHRDEIIASLSAQKPNLTSLARRNTELAVALLKK